MDKQWHVQVNTSFTECDDLQEAGLYASNGVGCISAWSSTPSPYCSTVAFCQAFVNSSNTYIQAFYDCNTSQTRFTWSSSGVWGTTSDDGYTKNSNEIFFLFAVVFLLFSFKISPIKSFKLTYTRNKLFH